MYRKTITTLKLEAKRRRASAMRHAKRLKRTHVSAETVEIGTVRSSGILGENAIQALHCGSESRPVSLTVRGEVVDARTLRGIRKMVSNLCLKRKKTPRKTRLKES